MQVRASLLISLLFTLLAAKAGLSTAAQADSQFFPETGKTLSGKFLAYWRANGGLATYGYPITDARDEANPEDGKTYLTQWFERNRFELHPENAGTRYEVLLGLLGKDLNRARLASDPVFQRADPLPDPTQPGDEQVYFEQTGHNLRGGFLLYWRANGGLERFGYPISEEHEAPDPAGGRLYVVQWFERARFEYHPENNPPYDILLGLLGREVLNNSTVPGFAWSVGGDYRTLPRATRLASDPEGNVYLLARDERKLLKYSGADGRFLAELPLPQVPQELVDIATDRAGAVYLLSRQYESRSLLSNWVAKFDRSGALVARWQPQKLQSSHEGEPISIGVDRQGHLYLGASTLSGGESQGRIFRYAADGRLLAEWGGSDAARSAIGYPWDIAVSQDGIVFVVDPTARRIARFTLEGGFIDAWAGGESGDGSIDSPDRVAIDRQGNVFVSDPANARIMKLDSSGRVLARWGGPGSADGQFGRLQEHNRVKDLGVDDAGNVYVLDAANWRVQKFGNDGSFLLKWGNDKPGQLFKPEGVAVDDHGFIYVADTGNARIQKFDPSGGVALAFGSRGYGEDQFYEPTGVAVDKDGNIYVTQSSNSGQQGVRPGVLKFDSRGRFLLRWGEYGESRGAALPGRFKNPEGIALDARGNVYVADSVNDRIQKFDPAGRFLGVFGWRDDVPERSMDMHDVAIDSLGNIYGAKYGPEHAGIRKFDAGFRFLLEWGRRGAAAGQFQTPLGLDVDDAGNLYVADTGNHRIQVFDPRGRFLATWGMPGTSNGRLDMPHDVAVDKDGNVYVVDAANRLQKFRPAVEK